MASPLKGRKLPIPNDDFLFIGAITQPHGIHGELRVHVFNPESDALFDIERIWLRPPGTSYIEPCDLLEVRESNKWLLMLLEGCDSRNKAELLRKTEIYVAKADLPALDADEFYFYQLIGLPVFDTGGEVLGEVVRVEPGAAQDLLVLQHKDREILIPITDSIIPVIDIPNRRIEIEVLPGLLEDDA